VGVRTLIHDQPDPDYLLRPAVLDSLAVLEERGMPFDVVAVLPRHLEIVSLLAERFPALTLVVDHLGHPPIGSDDGGGWSALIARAAQHPRVVAKVSGLYGTVDGAGAVTTESIRPAVERALEVFGPRRLLYGGDWPVSVLAGGYRATWAALRPLLDELSADDRDRVLGRTAADVYQLDPARLEAARRAQP
jgi:L-fuconolactonase